MFRPFLRIVKYPEKNRSSFFVKPAVAPQPQPEDSAVPFSHDNIHDHEPVPFPDSCNSTSFGRVAYTPECEGRPCVVATTPFLDLLPFY